MAILFSQKEEFRKAQHEKLEFYRGGELAGKATPSPPLMKPPEMIGGDLHNDLQDNDNDNNKSQLSNFGHQQQSPPEPSPPLETSPEEVKRKDKEYLAEAIAMAVAVVNKMRGEEDDFGKCLLIKAPDTFDRFLTKFR